MTSLWFAQLLRPRPGTYRKPAAAKLGLRQLEDRVTPAAFTVGNLVALRIGEGTASLNSAATAVFLDEVNTGGTVAQSIALPTTSSATAGSNRAMTDSGSAGSAGGLTRSQDGRFLTAVGYNLTAGQLTVVANTTAERVVGLVAQDGTVNSTTALPQTDAYNTNNIRSAATADGTSFYTSGTASTAALGGVRFVSALGGSSSVAVSSVPTNTRVVQLIGGQLYVSSSSGANIGINTVGTGTPTTSGQTTALLPGVTPINSYDYILMDRSVTVPGVDTLYLADQAAGLLKYS